MFGAMCILKVFFSSLFITDPASPTLNPKDYVVGRSKKIQKRAEIILSKQRPLLPASDSRSSSTQNPSAVATGSHPGSDGNTVQYMEVVRTVTTNESSKQHQQGQNQGFLATNKNVMQGIPVGRSGNRIGNNAGNIHYHTMGMMDPQQFQGGANGSAAQHQVAQFNQGQQQMVNPQFQTGHNGSTVQHQAFTQSQAQMMNPQFQRGYSGSGLHGVASFLHSQPQMVSSAFQPQQSFALASLMQPAAQTYVLQSPWPTGQQAQAFNAIPSLQGNMHQPAGSSYVYESPSVQQNEGQFSTFSAPGQGAYVNVPSYCNPSQYQNFHNMYQQPVDQRLAVQDQFMPNTQFAPGVQAVNTQQLGTTTGVIRGDETPAGGCTTSEDMHIFMHGIHGNGLSGCENYSAGLQDTMAQCPPAADAVFHSKCQTDETIPAGSTNTLQSTVFNVSRSGPSMLRQAVTEMSHGSISMSGNPAPSSSSHTQHLLSGREEGEFCLQCYFSTLYLSNMGKECT